MLNENIQPSSLDGIKRFAKQLKKAKGLPHHEALDVAAKVASFENYAHARRQLQDRPDTAAKEGQLFLTVYWYDRNYFSIGRETLEIEISKPLHEIATKSELKIVRGLGWFRLAARDHLVNDDVIPSQEVARKAICKAVRALRFMEATGLKPSRDSYAAYPKRDHNNKLPKSDHSTDWYDPETGQFILIDEPYLAATVESNRVAWAKKHNWHLQASKWPGMYYPHDCSLFVATDASTKYDFQNLMSKIDALPEPITEDVWDGVSVKGHDTFVSPQAKSSKDKRRAKAKGTVWRLSSKKTVPMQLQSPFNDRRPNAIMPIAAHQNVARMIKAVLQSGQKQWAVNTRLSSIRSKLEDWFFAERSREETDKYDLFYYGGISDDDPYVLKARTVKGNIELLNDIKRALQQAYVDCEPLRIMTKKIDTSIDIVSKLDD